VGRGGGLVQATCRAVYAESVPERLSVYVPVWMGWDVVWYLCLWRPGVSFCSFLRGRRVDADAAVIRAGMCSSYQ
jgi:hypothetical protein